MAGESKAAVIGAVAANFAIAAAKLLVGGIGGSSAMLSEGIHSGIDGANDLLLLLGLKRSKQQPDEQHPFGYGKELYFWSLIVSLSVLSVGGGVTVYEGIRQCFHPEPVKHAGWAYLALGCGVLFDGASLIYGLQQFRKQNRGKGLREAIRESKDPSTFMVLAEDSAAILGECIAAAGIFLNTRGMLRGDGVASILIGCMLGGVAAFLISETRDLVIGEAVEDEISDAIRELATGEGRFPLVGTPHTQHFGPETVLVTMEVGFDPRRPASELMEAVDRMQQRIRERFPAVKYVYIDPETIAEVGPSEPGSDRG
jgi:cation diffusion facilitator family transporter